MICKESLRKCADVIDVFYDPHTDNDNYDFKLHEERLQIEEQPYNWKLSSCLNLNDNNHELTIDSDSIKRYFKVIKDKASIQLQKFDLQKMDVELPLLVEYAPEEYIRVFSKLPYFQMVGYKKVQLTTGYGKLNISAIEDKLQYGLSIDNILAAFKRPHIASALTKKPFLHNLINLWTSALLEQLMTSDDYFLGELSDVLIQSQNGFEIY